MKKPHEQEWRRVARHGFSGPEMVETSSTTEPDLVCTVRPPRGAVEPGSDEPRARLIAAAPDMARALMAALEQIRMQLDGDPAWHKGGRTEKVAATIDAALRKAGVLP